MFEQDGLYKEILDNIYNGVYLVDTERKITYWNKGAENITGYPASEVINRHCSDNILIHVDESNNKLCETACPLKHTLIDGQSREAGAFFLHKNGHRVSTTIKSSAIRDATGDNWSS